MYLIDTVVFSELYKRRRHSGFVRWLSAQDENAFFLSTITLGEIERGIENQRGRNPPFADALLAWLDQHRGLCRPHFAGNDPHRTPLRRPQRPDRTR
jgi:predicted nucleic acid-binding protein